MKIYEGNNYMDKEQKILMVCLGNICRSPLAEGIMRSLALRNQLNWEIDSAGTGNWHVGEKPHHGSIEVARKHGLDISQQRARHFTAQDFHDYDIIFVMDESNLADVLRLAPSISDQKKVKLLLKAAGIGFNNVPDPYFDQRFDYVFNLLTEACKKIIYASTGKI